MLNTMELFICLWIVIDSENRILLGKFNKKQLNVTALASFQIMETVKNPPIITLSVTSLTAV